MLASNRRFFVRLCAATALTALAWSAGPAQAEVKGLELIAPTSPGGGWDQTARAMQEVLLAEKLASGVQVVNLPGGSGTIGLAQFITTKKRTPTLMVGGFGQVGGVIINKAPVTLDQVTPLARLIGEADVVVVPAESDIQTMGDLVAKLKADPAAVSWAGGTAGNADHVLVGLIAKAVGVDPTKLNYVAHAGGGEQLSTILGGHTTAGVSGWQEFSSMIGSGKLRALAVSSPERLAGVDVPTLQETGVDTSLVNWRSVFAPPNVDEADMKAYSDMVAQMVASPAWKEALAKRGWLDFYLPPDQFGPFLKQEQARIAAILQDLGLAN